MSTESTQAARSPAETSAREIAAAGAVPPDRRQHRHSYIVRHWRGEVPLPVSFWVNMAGLGLLVFALERWLVNIMRQADDPRPALLMKAVLLSASGILFVWQAVGTFQSARRSRAAKAGRFWPLAALAAVLLACLLFVVELPSALPDIKTEFDLALKQDPYDRYSLEVSADESTLYLRGTFGFGLPAAFKNFVREHPRVRKVVFDSVGGRGHSGLIVGGFLSRGDYSTEVETQCAGACILAFMGGTHRILGADAVMGFHRPGWFIPLPHAAVQREIAYERAFLLHQGVAAGFVDHIYATAYQDLWTPKSKELFDAGVVDGAVSGGKVMDAAAYAGALVQAAPVADAAAATAPAPKAGP